MSISKYILGGVILAIVILVIGVIYARYYKDEVKVGTLVDETEKQLGFDNYFPPNGQRGGDSGYPLGESAVLASVEPQGVFDQAGFKDGDAIPLSHLEFFGLILLNQKNRIEIPIIRDGENLVIQVDIPELSLSYDPCELRVFECNE